MLAILHEHNVESAKNFPKITLFHFLNLLKIKIPILNPKTFPNPTCSKSKSVLQITLPHFVNPLKIDIPTLNPKLP